MKTSLHYAEDTVHDNDAKLSALGWGGRAIDIEITLHDQKRGKEGEYRVIAVNKAGKSEPSNTVSAVL